MPGIVQAGLEDDTVTAVGRFLLEPLCDLAVDGILQIRDEESENSALALPESAGSDVRDVAEFISRLPHSRTRG